MALRMGKPEQTAARYRRARALTVAASTRGGAREFRSTSLAGGNRRWQVCPHSCPCSAFELAEAVSASYQLRDAFTIFTTDSITGTSTNTPTTVASAAPEFSPKRLMAAATANSGAPEMREILI